MGMNKMTTKGKLLKPLNKFSLLIQYNYVSKCTVFNKENLHMNIGS